MDVIADIAKLLFAPALLVAVGRIVLGLLPLVSDRVNARAVRLAKARHK
jgi:hypothetical protein